MNIHTTATTTAPTKKGPHPIDVAVGANVRQHRNNKQISQERLGEMLGITFQQVQKYEKGSNRISSSKLALIAAAFDVTIADLFKGVEVGAGEVKAPEPEDPRVHKATRIFKTIPPEKMDHALAVLATFTKA